jgi:hypothetical protein
LIVVDPRRTEIAEIADLHLAVRPGADAFLLGAVLARLSSTAMLSITPSWLSTRRASMKSGRRSDASRSESGRRPPACRSLTSSDAST